MKKLLSILLLIVSFNAVAGPSDSALYQKQYLKWRMKVPFWMDNGAYLQKIRLQSTGDSVLVAKGSNGLVGFRSASSLGTTYTAGRGLSLGGTTLRLDTTNQYKFTNGLIMGGNLVLGSATYTLYTSGNATLNDIYSYGMVGATSLLEINGKSRIYSAADGRFNLTNQANTSFTRLAFGLENTSFPSLQVNGKKLVTMLGDGSATSNFQVKDTVYSSIWNGQIDVPTKNAVYDKIEGLSSLYTYSAGNGLLLASNTFYRDSLNSTGQYGNSWQNGMMLKSTNNRSMLFGTNNLLAMTLDSNQRLGLGTRTPNSKIHALDGTVAEFKFNSGAASLTPNIAVGNTGASGKFASLIAGTTGGAFFYDAAGTFSIYSAPKSEYTNNTLGTTGTARFNISTTGNVTIGSTTSISQFAIPIAPTASANYGLFSMSNTTTAFDGTTTGKAVLAATGTYIAVNSVGSVAYNYLDFQKNGVSKYKVDSAGSVNTTGNLTITGNFSGNVCTATGGSKIGAAQDLTWLTRSAIQAPSAGVLLLTDAPAYTSFNRLQFGGQTSSFPALKRSTTTIQVRLADDSGNANLTVKDSVYDATAWDANISVPTKNAVRDKIEAMNVVSGTYSPTASDLQNVTSVSFTNCGTRYMRIGSQVTVTGAATVAITSSSTLASFEVTLPVSSTLTTGLFTDIAGVVTGAESPIQGVVTAENNHAQITWGSTGLVAGTYNINYTYTYTIN